MKQLAAVLVVTALLGAGCVVAGSAVLWGGGVALLVAGVLILTSVVAVVLYDPAKN